MKEEDLSKKFRKVQEEDGTLCPQNDESPKEVFENHTHLHQKKLHDNINSIFDEDRDKFIGEFTCKEYTIIRGYINGTGKQLRLYYTKLEPFTNKKATVCIVHGFGEHSGRFLHVKIKKKFQIVIINQLPSYFFISDSRSFSKSRMRSLADRSKRIWIFWWTQRCINY